MKYGISWYVGHGEHDYRETERREYSSLKDLLDGLLMTGIDACGEDELFEALVSGRQDTVYWLRDDIGFSLYHVVPSPTGKVGVTQA